MSPRPLTLEDKATEYTLFVKWPDEKRSRLVQITRHSNHGTWIEKGAWVACMILGPTNPWYVSDDGIWRYKYGHRYATAERALEQVSASRSLGESVDIVEGPIEKTS